MDGSGARMSLGTDRLRSGLGRPISDMMVDTRPVEQEAPSTSPPLAMLTPVSGSVVTPDGTHSKAELYIF
jgi:hypothetical protein